MDLLRGKGGGSPCCPALILGHCARSLFKELMPIKQSSREPGMSANNTFCWSNNNIRNLDQAIHIGITYLAMNKGLAPSHWKPIDQKANAFFMLTGCAESNRVC